jgi:hypothetical protein
LLNLMTSPVWRIDSDCDRFEAYGKSVNVLGQITYHGIL